MPNNEEIWRQASINPFSKNAKTKHIYWSTLYISKFHRIFNRISLWYPHTKIYQIGRNKKEKY